jgi:hypothetical protein
MTCFLSPWVKIMPDFSTSELSRILVWVNSPDHSQKRNAASEIEDSTPVKSVSTQPVP